MDRIDCLLLLPGLQTPQPAKLLSYVMLSPTYAKCSNAQFGPLEPGAYGAPPSYGFVLADTRSECKPPILVSAARCLLSGTRILVALLLHFYYTVFTGRKVSCNLCKVLLILYSLCVLCAHTMLGAWASAGAVQVQLVVV